MKKPPLRVGTEFFVNQSELSTIDVYDLIFGGYHEFVYLPDFYPLQLVNGSWQGALGHLLNGNHMNWIYTLTRLLSPSI